VLKCRLMRKTFGLALLASALLVGACGDDGGSGDDGGDLFPPKPECEGASIVPFQGTSPQVISSLEIGTAADGFDLDGDGMPDNKLAAVASLAGSAISESLAAYDIIIPIELFDAAAAAEDACVKFAIYLGKYVTDHDGDGDKPYVENGDCNDTAGAKGAAIHRGATEVAGNRYDDDCDGKADEDAADAPSTDDGDMDGDGQSMAAGDCDDTDAMIKTGAVEICGDGKDNDCDGVADRTQDASGNATACSPFEAGKQDIPLDPLSFETGTQTPVITFKDGTFTTVDGKLQLNAGPSLFSVAIPVTDGITLDLRISGATIQGDVVEEAGGIVIKNARLGGVIDAKTADTIRGLELDTIGLTPENSLLDAVFANLLGPLLALPKAPMAITSKYEGCRTPDIDVDRDGLEAFCDPCVNPESPAAANCPKDAMGFVIDPKTVSVCIDGDGTEVTDVVDSSGAVTMECSTAMKDGKSRFVDGISVALKFSTTKVKSLLPPQ